MQSTKLIYVSSFSVGNNSDKKLGRTLAGIALVEKSVLFKFENLSDCPA
jgi:hypothetical protein